MSRTRINGPSSASGQAFRNRENEILFIDARNLGHLVNRRTRVLSKGEHDPEDNDIKQITAAYHNWRNVDGAYEDVPGFCKAETIDQGWSLTQGSGGEDVDQNSELNDSVYVDWKSITPNASGEIEITINSPGPDMIGALALNFASITETSTIELISSFTSDLDSASPGNPATLSWEVVEPLDSLVLDDGNGNTTDLLPLTTGGTGSTAVSPTETTTYFITAVRGTNEQSKSLQIISGEAPEIVFFNTSADLIEPGSSVDLAWNVAGATTLTLDPGASDVTGSMTVNLTPTESTTYTLTATNDFGSTTAEASIERLAGPLPTHRNVASFPDNTDGLWLDQVGDRDWTMTGAILNSPLASPSANTIIAASYSTSGGATGGATTSFQYPEITIEVWFRPGNLTADHQVILKPEAARMDFPP